MAVNLSTPPPPPPGYSASDVVAAPPATTPATTPAMATTPPPPPPGYSASDVVASAPAGTQPSVSNTQPSQPAPQVAPQVAPQATISATPGSMPNDPMAAKAALWASNVASDLKHGTSITGVGKFLKSLGAHGFDVGGVSPQVADFMGSIPLGLLKAAKGAAEVASPGQKWQGTKDTIGGLLDASQIPSAFVAPEAGELAGEGMSKAGELAGEGISKAGSVASDAAKAVTGKASAIKKQFSLKAVQEALENSKAAEQDALESKLKDVQNGFHESVRGLLDDVASEAGVKPKPAESLNDVAANVSDAVKAKASSIYKQLDAAIGGGTRFQTFDEQLGNVKRALRNSAGIDPDADGRLIERINQIEDAKAAAMEQAKAKGVDPDLINNANATHRQAMALGDLSKQLQASMSGLRADLSEGVNAASEALSPAKLATRANRLYNSGRLQQAIGADRADDLLTHIETAKQAAKDAAEAAVKNTEAAVSKAQQDTASVKARRMIAGAIGASVALPKPIEWLKHLLGE